MFHSSRLTCRCKGTLHQISRRTCLSHKAVHPFTWVRLGNTLLLCTSGNAFTSLESFICSSQLPLKSSELQTQQDTCKMPTKQSMSLLPVLQLAWPSLLIKPRLRDFSCQKICNWESAICKRGSYQPMHWQIINYLAL